MSIGSRSSALLALAALVALGGACTPFKVQTPAGFVKLESSDHPYQAVSAAGAVLAVRHWDNEPEAKIGFWAKVVDDEITGQRGYKLQSSRPLRVGVAAGKWHHYLGDHKGERHFYVLALFVTDDHIFAVEATAPDKDYPRYQKAIERFVRSFSPE